MSQSPLQAHIGEQSLTSGAPRHDGSIVLDTNVALDWLLFNDPSSTHFAAAIARQELSWVASLAMRDELAAVLHRGLADTHGADANALLGAWDARVTLVKAAPPLPRAMGLQCSDPDDQKFLELAIAHGARWLLSRDRAVLRLARRARSFGLTISVPAGWPAA